MGIKKVDTLHWTVDIVAVTHGDKEHCGGQSDTELRAEISETGNQL